MARTPLPTRSPAHAVVVGTIGPPRPLTLPHLAARVLSRRPPRPSPVPPRPLRPSGAAVVGTAAAG